MKRVLPFNLNKVNSIILFSLALLSSGINYAATTVGVEKMIAAPKELYVFMDGVWSPNDPSGLITAADNILIVNGSVTLDGIINVKNVTILSGAVLNITGVLNLYGNLQISGDLIFKSSATQTGELGFVAAHSEIVGDATVERHLSNRRSYRMVSSAVSTSGSIHANWQEGAISRTDNPRPGFGTHITGTKIDQTNGFDATETGNPSMYTVDLIGQKFVPVPNTSVAKLKAGTAYLMFIRGDRSVNLDDNSSASSTVLSAKGKLLKGTTVQAFNTIDDNHFVMFGNPYQSCVDMASSIEGAVNINPGFYIAYDPTLADSGAYVIVSLPDGMNISGSSANQYLQPGHGGQLQVTGAGTAAIAFSEYDKAAGNPTTNNRPLVQSDFIKLQLYTQNNYEQGGSVQDALGIFFSDDFSNEKTLKDVNKPMNMGENLAIVLGGDLLGLEYREMPLDGERFKLFSSGYKHQNYTFKLVIEGLENSMFYLEDHYTGSSVLMNPGQNEYHFSVGDDASRSAERFSIRVESRLGINDYKVLSDVRVSPNPISHDHFYLHSSALQGELQLSLYDIAGRLVYENSVSASNSTKVSLNNELAPGVYLLKIKGFQEERTIRIIKE